MGEWGRGLLEGEGGGKGERGRHNLSYEYPELYILKATDIVSYGYSEPEIQSC
jgi:hypothetical protein